MLSRDTALDGEILPPDDFWQGDAEYQAQEAFRRLIRTCGSRTTAMRFWFEIPKKERGDAKEA